MIFLVQNVLIPPNHIVPIRNLKYNILKEFPVVFQNGSNYDRRFIIKNLAKEFGGEFNCIV